MKFLFLLFTFCTFAGVFFREGSGLKCWRCDNQGSSPRALACMEGTMKAEYAVTCNLGVTHCGTQWLIPEGVTKGIGAKITRDCGNEGDQQANSTEGCLAPARLPLDMDTVKEFCYCKHDLCNGKKEVRPVAKSAATAHGLCVSISFLWFTLLRSKVTI